MKKALFYTLVPILFLSVSTHAADQPYALLISIDGLIGDWAARPEANNIKLPNIQKLAARGTCAGGVTGVFPTVTYPSHTTLITGCRPARHGILANGLFNPPTQKSNQRWYWEYKFIQVPTLIDAAKSAGLATAAVSWPVTVDGPLDYNFPEIWPAAKFDDAYIEINQHTKPADLLARILTRYSIGTGAAGRDVSLTNAACYIIEQYKPHLMLVHLVELDDAQHSHGPDSPEARASAELSDTRVGEILAAYEKAKILDNTIVTIVSDHGFLPVNKSFNVNVAFRDRGLITPGKEKNDPATDYQAVAWIGGASAAIILKNPHDALVIQRVRDALAPYTGKPDSPIARIFDRAEIEKYGANPMADLMLTAGDGFTFGGRLSGEVIAESGGEKGKLRGMHGQFPDRRELEATFIAAGPGIAKGKVERIEMIDIAPTLAAAMNLSLPKAEGRPIAGVLAKR